MLRTATALVLLALAGSAAAQVVETDHLRSQLVAETTAIVPGQPLRVGLLLDHDPHWHTYWKNPGDSGLPTKLAFELPDGLAAGDIAWPAPQRFVLADIVNYGYSDRALLPVTLTVPASLAASEVTLRAKASWLICEVECIPGSGEYTLTLPVQPQADVDPQWQADFAWADARQPQPLDATAMMRLDGDAVVLDVRGDGVPALADATVFPATPQVFANAKTPQWTRAADGWTGRWTQSEFFAALPATVELVIVDGARASTLTVAAAAGAAAAPAAAPASNAAPPDAPTGLLAALAFAFLGGLILNLMPCVFPVLSLKALGAIESAEDRAALRAHGLWYAAGVVLSFVAVAGVLIALRAGGEHLGWGFQLQTPAFVAALALLLFAMALSFSGVWEFGAGMAGLGQRLTEGHGPRAAFFTGVLATVVASPCTAPFMGTALGYALAQPAYVAIAVFAALGTGLAAPMLLLGFVPALARLLPRPGAWMEGFRQLLAFPLYLTVVWLLWVYGEQTSALGMAYLLAALTLLAFALWLLRRRHAMQRPAWRVVAAASAACALAVAIGWPLLGDAPRAEARATAGAHHEPWSASRLDELRAAGRPVLVNMTAAWCLTCLANERIALSTDRVRDAMKADGIVYLKGDWTLRDAAITAYLESFGRNGVPLYVLYPADGGAPQVLPQLLTPDGVIAAFDSIRSPNGGVP